MLKLKDKLKDYDTSNENPFNKTLINEIIEKIDNKV